MKKTRIIVGLVGLLGLLTATIFYARTRPPKQTLTPTTTIAPINPNTLPASLANISSYSNVPALTFPTTIPVYSLSETKTAVGEFSRLANALDISTAPQTISGSRGQYLIANQGEKSLTLSENPLAYAYTNSSSPSGFINYDVTSLREPAMTYLEALLVIKSPVSVVFGGYKYLNPKGPSPNAVASPSVATVLQIDFTLMLDGFPLFVSDTQVPAHSVRYNNTKSIVELRGFLLPDIQKQDQVMNIIPYSDAVVRLQANQGVLSSVTVDGLDGPFLTGETPVSVEIKSVSLGYFLAPQRDSLVPVFIFYGAGYLEKERRNVNTTTIVSAVP